MSTVSTLEFSSSLPLTCDDSSESTMDLRISSYGYSAVRSDSEQATACSEHLNRTRNPSPSHWAEDLTAIVALIVASIGAVFLVGLWAADVYASLIQYSPLEIVRALGGLY